MHRLKTKPINLVIIGVMMMQNGDVIKKVWILLDTCSTDRVAKNLDYAEDVKNCTKDKDITLLMNGVSLIFDRKGRLTVYL